MVTLRYEIHVDLDVFKALTAAIAVDGATHNDVIRDLLNLDSPIEADEPESPFAHIADALGKPVGSEGFYSRGLLLPDGTSLRARYKGKEYRADILEGQWCDQTGAEFSSPSAAAHAITGNNVNGWRFWEAKRPGDLGWRRLDILAARRS